MTLQDLGNIGDFVGAVAVLLSLIYLAVQVRHNTRGLEQNAELMRLSFEQSIRHEAVQFRSAISGNADLARIWSRGLAGTSDFDPSESVRFELLMVNVVALLRAQFAAEQRGGPLAGTGFFLWVTSTTGFRQWWEKSSIR